MRGISLWPLTLPALCLTLPMTAGGALLLINNPGFESPAAGPGQFLANATSWMFYNTGGNTDRISGVWNPAGTASYLDPVPDGARMGVAFLNNTSNFAEAGLQQMLSATLQPSTRYTLTVEVGNFAPDGVMFDFTGFPGYRVDLLAGSTVLASDNNTLLPGEGRFLTSTVSFVTGTSPPQAGQALGIRLVNLNGPNGVEVNFDRVRLDAVPEPSRAVLLALGAGLALKRRRRA